MDIRDFKVGDKVRVKPLIELARVGLNGENWLVDLIGRELTVMEVHRREERGDAFVVTGSGLVRVAFSSAGSLEALERATSMAGSPEVSVAANKWLKSHFDQDSDDKLTKHEFNSPDDGDRVTGHHKFYVGQYVRALEDGSPGVTKNEVLRVRAVFPSYFLLDDLPHGYAYAKFANAGDFTAAKRLGSKIGDSISQVQAQFVHGVLDLFGVPIGIDDPLKWLHDWRFAVLEKRVSEAPAILLAAMRQRAEEAERKLMLAADDVGVLRGIGDSRQNKVFARDEQLIDVLSERNTLKRENAVLKERIRKLERRG